MATSRRTSFVSFVVALAALTLGLPATGGAQVLPLPDSRGGFLNPDADGPGNVISVRPGTSGYHFVLRIPTVEPGATVHVQYSTTPLLPLGFTDIGEATRVGQTDTWELFWPEVVPAGQGWVRAEIRQDPITVVGYVPSSTGVPVEFSTDRETVEITAPANGDTLGFDEGRRATVGGTASAGANRVELFYTTSGPVADPQWTPCGTVTLPDAPGPKTWTGTCTTATEVDPADVTGIGARAVKGTGTQAEPHSGDAHRVFGHGQQSVIAVTATPESTTNHVGTAHTVTAAVTRGGAPAGGEAAHVRVTIGPHADDDLDGDATTPAGYAGSCTTPDDGTCTVAYTGIEIGQDTITVWVNAGQDDDPFTADGDDPQAQQVFKTWTPPPTVTPGTTERLWGSTRFETAVAISRNDFPTDRSAGAVVLARGDQGVNDDGFADALAGAPLAARHDAPLLITDPSRLHPTIEAELRRVLAPGRTVFLLGGDAALSPAVAARVAQLGYTTQRIFGTSRIETAIAVARALGDPDSLLITTGYNFPDALAAAAVAAQIDGAVLLTISERRHPETDAYLNQRGGATRFAVGGPAARPYPEAQPLFGPSREETAVEVARRFFPNPAAVGVAQRGTFPDSLTGGVHVARRDGPMLLTFTDRLHPQTARYLCDKQASITTAFLYGGVQAINDQVRAAIGQRIQGQGC